MSLVIAFVFVFLSCVPLSATYDDIPICKESFGCRDIGPFKYPFYQSNETYSGSRCGLIGISCNPKGDTVQIGRGAYEIFGKVLYNNSSLWVYNRSFEKLVKDHKCEALMNNVTSPDPLLFSISIKPNITLYKCPKNSNQTSFQQPIYNNYNICKDHNFYFKNPISDAKTTINHPNTCQVIQLPMKEPWGDGQQPDVTNIFSFLSAHYFIFFNLSDTCKECQKNASHCHSNNGHVECLDIKKAKKTSRGHTLILTLLGLSVGVVTVIIFILCLKRKVGWRKKVKYNFDAETFLTNNEFLAPKRYSYSQIKKITSSFEVKIGQGGFGSVYKGSLSNGSLVAVKILSELKRNGEDFINEVASVGNTSHVNIVSLVGFCLEDHQKALIYEFMPNGSLEKFIHGRNSSSNIQLGWKKLYEIAIGIARGLEYLHRGCNTRILHFDIKPHNILLDKDFCPKISDFGLAKLFPEDKSMISMSIMRGTPGYIAPELFSRSFGQVSHKSDVYSYGMMILEMVGGRRNIEVDVDHTSEIYFPHWIYKKVELDEGQIGLYGIVNDEQNEMAKKMIIVGLWCIQTNPLTRPTITTVLEMLQGDLASLERPPKPYLCSPSRSVNESPKDNSQPYSSSADTL